MKSGFLGWLLAGLVAASLAAWALGRLQTRVPVADATDWMGDGFTVWEQWDGRAARWIPYPWLEARSGSLAWGGEWLALGAAEDAEGLGIAADWRAADAQGKTGVRQVEGWNPAAVTRFRGDSADVELWHIFPPEGVDWDQVAEWVLAPGWEARVSRGGILLGTAAAWARFSDVPGEMAEAWHGRRHGYHRLQRTDVAEGVFWASFFVPMEESGRWGAWTGTEWRGGTEADAAPGAAVLPMEWAFLTGVDRQDWSSIRIRREDLRGPEPDSLLVGRWNGTVATLRAQAGGTIHCWGWSDTVGLADAYAGWGLRPDSLGARYAVQRDGLVRWDGTEEEVRRNRSSWEAWRAQDLGANVDAGFEQKDGWWWDGERTWGGSLRPGGRMAWTTATSDGGGRGGQTVAAVLPPVLESAPDSTGLEVGAAASRENRTMGSVRNHRSGGTLTCRWESGKIRATEGGVEVWNVEAPEAAPPFHRVFEVDLYRNGKYQTAYAQPSSGLHLVDVLGREATGFPLRSGNSRVTAWWVADYDRDQQFRFLVAFEDGSLKNWRDEGQPTPGWNFQPSSHGAITYLEPIRVGSKDYLFAGHRDGFVRLLSRSGEDRATTAVRVPSGQVPAFRLGATIEASTVLYFDAEGVLQERTIGDNRAVGLSGKAKGDSVRLEDTDGDGKPEVVVMKGGKRQVFNARNEPVG